MSFDSAWARSNSAMALQSAFGYENTLVSTVNLRHNITALQTAFPRLSTFIPTTRMLVILSTVTRNAHNGTWLLSFRSWSSNKARWITSFSLENIIIYIIYYYYSSTWGCDISIGQKTGVIFASQTLRVVVNWSWQAWQRKIILKASSLAFTLETIYKFNYFR